MSLGYRSTSFELARERRARRKRRARGRRPALERVNEKGGGKSRSEVTPFVTSLTQRAYRLLARSVRDVGDGSLRSVELLREERARSDASPGCPRTSGRRETSLVALTMHSYARARLDNQDAARAPGDLPRDDARREARGRLKCSVDLRVLSARTLEPLSWRAPRASREYGQRDAVGAGNPRGTKRERMRGEDAALANIFIKIPNLQFQYEPAVFESYSFRSRSAMGLLSWPGLLHAGVRRSSFY